MSTIAALGRGQINRWLIHWRHSTVKLMEDNFRCQGCNSAWLVSKLATKSKWDCLYCKCRGVNHNRTSVSQAYNNNILCLVGFATRKFTLLEIAALFQTVPRVLAAHQALPHISIQTFYMNWNNIHAIIWPGSPRRQQDTFGIQHLQHNNWMVL